MFHPSLSILYVGPYDSGSCQARYNALLELGHHPIGLSFEHTLRKYFGLFGKIQKKFMRGPAVAKFNRVLLNTVQDQPFDWVWIDKGAAVYPETLSQLRKKNIFLVHHLTDDFRNTRQNLCHYLRGVPLYDVHMSIHAVHKDELKNLGARMWIQTSLGFDPVYCFPGGISPSPISTFKCDIIFIGHWEEKTEELVVHLLENGIDLRVWGEGWDRASNWPRFRDRVRTCGLYGPDYSSAIASAKIALCILSKWNRNKHTMRTFEIPAIGTFMLAERTDDHCFFFEEGKEAEFFDTKEELLEKSRFFLQHDERRRLIATAGHKRAMNSGYTFKDVISRDLARLMPIYREYVNT